MYYSLLMLRQYQKYQHHQFHSLIMRNFSENKTKQTEKITHRQCQEFSVFYSLSERRQYTLRPDHQDYFLIKQFTDKNCKDKNND